MSIPVSQFIPPPSPPWCSYFCSLHLYLYFCFANKIIYWFCWNLIVFECLFPKTRDHVSSDLIKHRQGRWPPTLASAAWGATRHAGSTGLPQGSDTKQHPWLQRPRQRAERGGLVWGTLTWPNNFRTSFLQVWFTYHKIHTCQQRSWMAFDCLLGSYSHQNAQHFSLSRKCSRVSSQPRDPSSDHRWSAFSPCRFSLPVVGFLVNEITPYLVPCMRSVSHLFL